jgi:hypothetical protein
MVMSLVVKVKKGSKAYAMLLPVTVPKKDKAGKKIEGKFSRFFMPRDLWFTVHQTEGEDYVENQVTPEWDKQKALETLLIKENAYESADGNVPRLRKFSQLRGQSCSCIPTQNNLP